MDVAPAVARARIFATISGVIALASLIALGVTLHDRARTGVPAPHALPIAESDESAPLVVDAPRIEFTADKARRVRDAIKQGDYRTARQVTSEVLKASRMERWRFYPFSDFMNAISDVSDAAFAAHLNEWVAQSKGDAIPLLLRAQYDRDMAWYRRGGKFAREIAADNAKAFFDYSGQGLLDIDAAIAFDGSDPYAYDLKLRLLHGFGVTDEMARVFEEAVARYPGYYALYDEYLGTIEPRWGGTVKAMYAFVGHYADDAPQDSPLKLLYLTLYDDLLGSASAACSDSKDNDKRARCVGTYMSRFVTPGLNQEVLAALQLYDHTDKAEFGFAIHKILSDMLRSSGANAYANEILQLAATSMHSNTQLKEDKPGANDYVIDKIVADSWYQQGFYDNALRKAEEAAKDVAHTVFADEEQKALALAGIDELIADSKERLHQYADMITAAGAALKLGGRSDERLLICYGRYQMNQFLDAVRDCAAAMGDATYDVAAHYWRGLAYRDLGKADEALDDLKLVAASEHGFRSGAAISMSVIDFDRKDPRGALDVLNKYTFLYDPNSTSRDDIAVAYNNRCYAYMLLGDLHKALSDCTASLKFGNLPDAVRKEQDLLKRLGTPESDL